MNRAPRYGILVLLLSLLLTACSSGATGSAPTRGSAVASSVPAVAETSGTGDGTQIVIGVSLPLTGRFSDPGQATKRGYEVWASLVNANGGLLGRQIQLRILDNATDQKTAVADYERLITVDKVNLVVGPFSSFLVLPTSEVAARHSYVFVEPAGGALEVFNRGLNNLFFAQPAISTQQADAFVTYIRDLPKDQQPKTFGVVSQDDPFTLSVVTQLKEQFIASGMKLVVDEIYAPETSDFTTIASEVAKVNPDLIIGGTMQQDSVGQILAYREAHYQPRGAFFTSGPSMPDAFRTGLGSATNGIFSSISWFAQADTSQNREFTAEYIKLFGGTADDIAEDSANAFTVGQVLQQAVTKIQSIDNGALIKEIHTGTYQTVVGPLHFDAVGRPKGSFMILQWQGDHFVIVMPADRAQAQPIWPKPAW
ncbi:MAG: amino acid ABC transporter substrate-binding protein [Chloroflexales bacterium]